MGNLIAGIFSNFTERDFTKTPLTDEEIDVLIGQIPKDDVLDSLNQEDKKTIVNNYPVDGLIEQIPKDDVLDSLNQDDKEIIVNNYPVSDLIQRLGQSDRERIVQAMSDQKIFNLKGDSIFDYYFANNKDELKNCMKGHMNKDGTPCSNKKFRRMITTIPDLVIGPLGEKQTQWEEEKRLLEEKKGTLNTKVGTLNKKIGTLNTEIGTLKIKQNIDEQKWVSEKDVLQEQLKDKEEDKAKLVLDKAKLVLDNQNLVTKHEEDIDKLKDNHDQLLRLKQDFHVRKAEAEKEKYDKLYEKKKELDNKYSSYIYNVTGLPDLSLTYKECKEYAGDKWGHDQYHNQYRVDNQPYGCLLHSNGKYYYNENGQAFKKIDCSKDYPCIQKNTKNLFKIRPKIRIVHVNSDTPDKSVSEEECKTYAERAGYNYSKVTHFMTQYHSPVGCYYEPVKSGHSNAYANTTSKVYWNPKDAVDEKFGSIPETHKVGTCRDNQKCVQKDPLNKEDFRIAIPYTYPIEGFKKVTDGDHEDILSVSESECEQYAKDVGQDFKIMGHGIRAFSPLGCQERDNVIQYNPKDSTGSKSCKPKSAQKFTGCIQKGTKYDKYVNKEECEHFAKLWGLDYSVTKKDHEKPGCLISPHPGTHGKSDFPFLVDPKPSVSFNQTLSPHTTYQCSYTGTCVQKK